jgi:hypothetical protein
MGLRPMAGMADCVLGTSCDSCLLVYRVIMKLNENIRGDTIWLPPRVSTEQKAPRCKITYPGARNLKSAYMMVIPPDEASQ